MNRDRRRFIGFCATSAAAAAAALPGKAAAESGDPVQTYARVRLVGPEGGPLQAARLERGVNYVFHYPYVSTPCFLLDLGEPITRPVELHTREDHDYVWSGGVGPNRSIVAYSAICSHRMTYPAESVSFISYHEPGLHHGTAEHGVIHCCSEDSVYDPAAGARVLSGPAPEPLAAIELEYDADRDALLAVGATGGTLFDRFLVKFRHRLEMNWGSQRYRRPVEGRCEVVTLDAFSRGRFSC